MWAGDGWREVSPVGVAVVAVAVAVGERDFVLEPAENHKKKPDKYKMQNI